jgi:N-methylhydantoinase A
MERAIRVITVERGQDPRTCVLVPFGGAAGLHACGLAEELGISRILIPPDPGLLSAWGMLNAPLVRDLTRSLRIVDPTFADLRPISARLARMATSSLAGAGAPATAIRTRTFVRLRYLGEGSTLEIPLERSFLREFAREHSRLFHSEERDGQIECTSIRATASAASAWPKPARSVGRADDSAASGRRVAISLDGKLHNVPIVARVDLRRARMKGPCLITEYSSTSLLAPGWTLRGDTAGNLHLES